jgi:hypothetical protein
LPTSFCWVLFAYRLNILAFASFGMGRKALSGRFLVAY